VLGAVAVVAWTLTLIAVAARPQPSAPSPPSPIVSQVTYVQGGRRELSTLRGPVTLHRLVYRSAGGIVTIRWYDSDLESLTPHRTAVVSLYIDGRPVGATIKTSTTGVYEDGQGDLVWRGVLSAGSHRIRVQFDSDAPWGVPYTGAGLFGIDALIIDGGPRARA
jgi:hypothetical protein